MARLSPRWMSLFLVSLLLAGLGFSQSTQTGAISGSVTDPSGAVVAGATITVVNDATKTVERTAVSTADGLFSATLLPPGDYTVTIKKSGFKTVTEKITVLLNESSRLDAKLEVGATNEVVEVTANATTVNTESAVMGNPVDAATMHNLPLPVPNFMFLLSLSAGTAGEFPDVRQANRGIVDINVNGQRTTNNSVTLEGIAVNDFNLAHFDTVPLPNPHAIEEFNVATSLYDATSETKGGGAVGLVFKSGTKDWHGEAYWQHRNDFLNANEWFFNELGKTPPEVPAKCSGLQRQRPHAVSRRIMVRQCSRLARPERREPEWIEHLGSFSQHSHQRRRHNLRGPAHSPIPPHRPH